MKRDSEIILGIETGLDGGSISILENGIEVESLKGLKTVSKTEDVLLLLEGILDRNEIGRENIKLIAISSEHGSLTGNRIGLAISKGLADAFSAKLVSVSLLEMLAFQNMSEGIAFAAILTNRETVVFGEFRKSADKNIASINPPVKTDPKGFIERLVNLDEKPDALILTENLFKIINEEILLKPFLNSASVSIAEDNWATQAAFYAARNLSEHASDNETAK